LLHKARQGRVAWVSANGGLISNLKVWENVTLPLWSHFRHDVTEAEQRVKDWLPQLGLEKFEFADFMAAPPASLELWQRKLAGLLRALVQMPQLLVFDALLLEAIDVRISELWIAALEHYASQSGIVLAITDRPTSLPWANIE
jgi:phospholipid/cholesterol/gamma-HCH transport system ATP-binding protein